MSASSSSSLVASAVSSSAQPTLASSTSSLVASVISSSSQPTSASSSSSLVASAFSSSAQPTLASSTSSLLTSAVPSPSNSTSLSLTSSLVTSLNSSSSKLTASTAAPLPSLVSLSLSPLVPSLFSPSLKNSTSLVYPPIETSKILSTPHLSSTLLTKVEPSPLDSTSRYVISPSQSRSTVRPSISVRPTRPPLVACHVICQLAKSKPNTRPLSDMEPPLNTSKKIAIVEAHPNATWSAYYDSTWHIVSNFSATNALVLGHADKLQYVKTLPNFVLSLSIFLCRMIIKCDLNTLES